MKPLDLVGDRTQILPLAMPKPSVDIAAKPRPRPRIAPGRMLLPLQPMPLLTRVVHFVVFGTITTSIMRTWRSGDSGPAGLCQLCDRCTAYGDGCLTVVGRRVEHEDAALFSIVGMKTQDLGGQS